MPLGKFLVTGKYLWLTGYNKRNFLIVSHTHLRILKITISMNFEALTLSRLGWKENLGDKFCCTQVFVAQRGAKNRRKNTHIFQDNNHIVLLFDSRIQHFWT